MTATQSIFVTAILIMAGALLAFNWTFISAYLYWPFDRSPPELTISQLADPKQRDELLADRCAWAKRNAIRDPGLISRAMRESACEKY